MQDLVISVRDKTFAFCIGLLLSFSSTCVGLDNTDFVRELESWTVEGDVGVVTDAALLSDKASTHTFLYQGAARARGSVRVEFDFRSLVSKTVPQNAASDTFFASLYFIHELSRFDLQARVFDDAAALMDTDFTGTRSSVGAISESARGPEWHHFEAIVPNRYAFVVAVFELVDQNGIPDDSAVLVDNVVVEETEETKPLTFTAYNDFSWAPGQLNENITLFTTDVGKGERPAGSSGFLRDYATGQATPVTLAVQGGVWAQPIHPRFGALSEQGTEAYDLFQGKVDATGVLSYGPSAVELRLRGLNPALRYHLTLFGNRNRKDYADRITKTTLSGQHAFVNQSSPGSSFAGDDDPSTSVVHGYNSEKGYVVRYQYVEAGPDGEVKLTIEDGGSPAPPKYYVNALCVEAVIDDRLPFVAYNDFSWAEGQLNENITRYTMDNGSGDTPSGSSGLLIDHASGRLTSATLTVRGGAWIKDVHSSFGALSQEGTDAYEHFQGKVDATGVLSYGTSPIELLFSGLNPVLRYHVVVFGNRNLRRYADRVTQTTLSGHESFVNKSTPGAGFTGSDDPSTSVAHGYNFRSGLVARFKEIEPGEDGSFRLTLGEDGVPGPSRHYLNALSIEAVERE